MTFFSCCFHFFFLPFFFLITQPTLASYGESARDARAKCRAHRQSVNELDPAPVPAAMTATRTDVSNALLGPVPSTWSHAIYVSADPFSRSLPPPLPLSHLCHSVGEMGGWSISADIACCTRPSNAGTGSSSLSGRRLGLAFSHAVIIRSLARFTS